MFDSDLCQFIMACSNAGLGNTTHKRKCVAKAARKQAKRNRRTTVACTLALAVNHTIKEIIRK